MEKIIKITGDYNIAFVFTQDVEVSALQQIVDICDDPAFKDSTIRIMPDAHAGKGCTIGTTMTITNKIVPDMVGVDIGCGMLTLELLDENGKTPKEIDLKKLDDVIRQNIPYGRRIRENCLPLAAGLSYTSLVCGNCVDFERGKHSIGTLGGGNHFIELSKSANDGKIYLVIHSGSRHLGYEVAKYYQNKAEMSSEQFHKINLHRMISAFKREGRERDIQDAIVKFKQKALARKKPYYLAGQDFSDYIHDMDYMIYFSCINRLAIVDEICAKMGFRFGKKFTTIHNYFDTEEKILRKGAVSAKEGERLLIPLNMRDGSLVCIGKGNPNWNYSAPHGAGRRMSRSKAFENLSFDKFKADMENVYSTTVSCNTLDEAPDAYKDSAEIISRIKPTVAVVDRLLPIYNFKSED